MNSIVRHYATAVSTGSQARPSGLRYRPASLAVILASLILFLGGCRVEQRRPPQGKFQARVVGIQDGDTITVLVGQQQVRVRLHGIDCPERGQPYFRRARAYTASRVFGKEVTVEVVDRDRYGRLVARVYTPEGEELNRALVREGLAWWYQNYAPGDQELERLQAEARAERRGLWSQPHPVIPWEWRVRERARR